MNSSPSSKTVDQQEAAIEVILAIGWHSVEPHRPIKAIAERVGIDEDSALQILRDLIKNKKVLVLAELPADYFSETGEVRFTRFKWVRANPNE
ncbi:MAG: hypothetical protein M3Y72_10975 [Acidobacteriota bacterium]|nr:hypothetical protein [Acidobacteriota bacterium]